MTGEDAARLQGVQRKATDGVQRYARAADKAADDQIERAMRDLRSYVAGLKEGLTAMGLTPEVAQTVIGKAGWDSKTSSYRIFERPSVWGLDKPRKSA